MLLLFSGARTVARPVSTMQEYRKAMKASVAEVESKGSNSGRNPGAPGYTLNLPL